MTMQREAAAIGDNSDRLHVEFSRLLCNYGNPATCRAEPRES